MEVRIGIDVGSESLKAVKVHEDGRIEQIGLWPIQGRPWARALEVLELVIKSGDNSCLLGVTGSGSEKLAEFLSASHILEDRALVSAVRDLYPKTRTIIEMGREGQGFFSLKSDPASGRLGIDETGRGSKCASGAGSFIDSMSARLQFASLDDFIKAAIENAGNPAPLAGRCVVFTETDIIHLINKGISKERVAAGIIQAICLSYLSNVAKNKKFPGEVIFVGGVSQNKAMIAGMEKAIEKALGKEMQIIVPEFNRSLGAIGTAKCAEAVVDLNQLVSKLKEQLAKPFEYEAHAPLSIEKSIVNTRQQFDLLPQGSEFEKAALGVDIGSMSTKAALVTQIDGKFVILASYYRKTAGDPLAAVRDTLVNIANQVKERGYKIGKISACTTGSGRYLSAKYMCADIIRNEISAQASGALAYDEAVDTIFEIGGQDSKYIRLDGGIIIDSEMNRACAAGCGAFLEKQAEALGIKVENMGKLALGNTRPPELNPNCTVFTASAMLFYQQNNMPAEDLAAAVCLASVVNYINKNVADRSIGDRIAFHGAPALNMGMVAAFEAVTGKQIIVPSYPEITGAVGAARLVYLENIEESTFRGLEETAKIKYTVSSFVCPGKSDKHEHCNNLCDVNVFQIEEGPKYFYNDRCEKFSGDQKQSLKGDLPNLFDIRESMIKEAYPILERSSARTIGIPRGGMTEVYRVLYRAFLGELGFNVVESGGTNQAIIDKGLAKAIDQGCFPFKVAHGHVLELVDLGVDAIFFPTIFSTEKLDYMRQSKTCPYWQAAPDVISRAVGLEEKGIELITPRVNFDRGWGHVERQFVNSAVELGRTRQEAKAAFAKARAVYDNFNARVRDFGKLVLEALPQDATAIVLVARPYTLWDERMRMGINDKIQDLGILAIPQDFLPLDGPEANISDSWPNAYSRQIQKKLSAARLIRQDVRLRAIVVTYFACGQDSFGNPFFKDEVGKSCYVMHLDEHTADAGIITRLEAFMETVKADVSVKDWKPTELMDKSIHSITDRKVWIPKASSIASVLAGAMSSCGITARVLDSSKDPTSKLARQAIPEDVCLPMFKVTDDILQRIKCSGFNRDEEAFFMGNSQGPCRFGMYEQYLRLILDKKGFQDVPIVTLGSMNADAGLGITFGMLAWAGMVAQDLLCKMVTKVRPYEIKKGESDACFDKYLKKLVLVLPKVKKRMDGKMILALTSTFCISGIMALLRRAQKEFSKISVCHEKRPLIGVIGEWYVRTNEDSNQNLIRKLESEGAEVWLAPPTEFFFYSNFIDKMLSYDRMVDELLNRNWPTKEIGIFIQRSINHSVMTKYEHALYHACCPLLKDRYDIGPEEVVKNGSQYVDWHFGGESICSMGKSTDFAKRGLDGIVNVIPFCCMPGNIVTALSASFKQENENIPWLNLDFDGFEDATRDQKIKSFVWQVNERAI